MRVLVSDRQAAEQSRVKGCSPVACNKVRVNKINHTCQRPIKNHTQLNMTYAGMKGTRTMPIGVTVYAVTGYCCLALCSLLCPLITAWNPDLMLWTEQREPHVSHWRKNSRVSFCRRVSGERHVWQVTYSSVGEGNGKYTHTHTL